MRNHAPQAPSPLTLTFSFRRSGTRSIREGETVREGTVPRITRLMALALKFDGLINRGEVRDYADLARLGYVTRARITQIMNLLNLAPDIQEAILFLPRTTQGRDPISERDVRPIASLLSWQRQRELWSRLAGERLKLK